MWYVPLYHWQCTTRGVGANTALILTQAENALNNWRSDIGKAGHIAVVEFWRENPGLFSSPEDRADYVADSLVDMRFVYRFPDISVSVNYSVTPSGARP